MSLSQHSSNSPPSNPGRKIVRALACPKPPAPPAPEKKNVLNFSTPQKFVDVMVIQNTSPSPANLNNQSPSNPTTQTFTIHKSVLCHRSAFFNKAFNSTFLEGETQRVVLPDVEVSIFGVLVNWCYIQNLETAEGAGLPLVELAKLWMLGERFMMPKLQNGVLDELYNVLPKHLLPMEYQASGSARKGKVDCFLEFLKVVYGEDRSKEDKIRHFTVEAFSWTLPIKIHEFMDALPREFVADVMYALMMANKGREIKNRTKPLNIRRYYVKEGNEDKRGDEVVVAGAGAGASAENEGPENEAISPSWSWPYDSDLSDSDLSDSD